MSGFTGEWIIKVVGITGPEHASVIDDLIHQVIERDGLVNAEILFDASRWEGGDW